MAQERPRKFPFKLVLIPLVIVGLFVFLAVSLARTSTNSYCLSCHEMERYQEASLHRCADLLITTEGMSVDPDDVTRLAISRVGVDRLYYGAGALPGSMFLLAYRGEVPLMGVPACALYHEATIVDLILPRLLAGEKPDRHDLARLAHGGLCYDCPACRFPACPFGK